MPGGCCGFAWRLGSQQALRTHGVYLAVGARVLVRCVQGVRDEPHGWPSSSSLHSGWCAGADEADATSARQPAPDFAAGLRPAAELPDRPLAGRRLAVVAETRGAGVAPGVSAAVDRALQHLESLGAKVGEVRRAQGAGCRER